MSTGYTARRASRHDQLVNYYVQVLRHLGYGAVELPVDGHRPDIALHDGRGDYLDVKTSQAKNNNLAIEVNSLQTYWNIQRTEGKRVYILHHLERHNEGWVMLPESVEVIRGPIRRSNGDNSNDDWHLCKPGDKCGTRFSEFFTPLPWSDADITGRH